MRRALTFAAVFALAAVFSTLNSPASPETCKNPDWKTKPTSSQVFAIWPRVAYQKGRNGAAEISCTVSIQGALRDCTVVREAPPDEGFGQAAIALTPQFTMYPKVCDGRPIEGAVDIPINFSGLSGPPVKLGSRIAAAPDLLGNMPLVVDRPAWIAAPTYAQVAGAYPAAGRHDKAPAHVALNCDFAGNGRLHHCSILSEVPKGHGYGAAAQALSKDFVGPDTDAAGRKMRDNTTVIAFTFDPEMLSGQTPVIGKPQWTHVPQSVDLAASFPAAAAAAHVLVGHVVMACDVGTGGHLQSCVVSRESPAGLGFDRAALALSAIFQVTVWTDEGLPTVGGHVTVPIRYEASGELAPQSR